MTKKPIPKQFTKEVQAKGQAALKQWREDKAYAERKGGKILEAWLEEQQQKLDAKMATSPTYAIRKFCNACVGGKTEDVTNCTAPKCPLYNFRPYQK